MPTFVFVSACAQLDKTHKGKHAYYGNPKKRSIDRFSILHFAGELQ